VAELADALVQGLFKVWSAVYDRPIFQRTFYRRVHAVLLALCDGAAAPGRVLDLGCGTAHKEPARALGEIRAALAPGGLLLLATLSSEVLRVAALRRALELGMADRTRLAPPDETRRDLESAGFTVGRVEAVRPGVRVFEAISS
jgi:SAM-dependent methyltransferase